MPRGIGMMGKGTTEGMTCSCASLPALGQPSTLFHVWYDDMWHALVAIHKLATFLLLVCRCWGWWWGCRSYRWRLHGHCCLRSTHPPSAVLSAIVHTCVIFLLSALFPFPGWMGRPQARELPTGLPSRGRDRGRDRGRGRPRWRSPPPARTPVPTSASGSALRRQPLPARAWA